MTKETALKCVIDSYTYAVSLVIKGYADGVITFQDQSNIALLLCEIRNDWVRINYELSPYQMQSAIQKFNTYNEDDVQNHFNQKRKELKEICNVMTNIDWIRDPEEMVRRWKEQDGDYEDQQEDSDKMEESMKGTKIKVLGEAVLIEKQ